MTTPSTIHPEDRAPVRSGDPDTSQRAADSVSVMPSWIEFAHLAIDMGQFTAEELVEYAADEGVKYKPSRLRTCMREWEQYGWLHYTGAVVRTESGRRARIAELTPVGWRKAEELTGRTVDEWGNPTPRDGGDVA